MAFYDSAWAGAGRNLLLAVTGFGIIIQKRDDVPTRFGECAIPRHIQPLHRLVYIPDARKLLVNDVGGSVIIGRVINDAVLKFGEDVAVVASGGWSEGRADALRLRWIRDAGETH